MRGHRLMRSRRVHFPQKTVERILHRLIEYSLWRGREFALCDAASNEFPLVPIGDDRKD